MDTIPAWPHRGDLRRPKGTTPEPQRGWHAVLVTKCDGKTFHRLLRPIFDTEGEADKYGREYAADCRCADSLAGDRRRSTYDYIVVQLY